MKRTLFTLAALTISLLSLTAATREKEQRRVDVRDAKSLILALESNTRIRVIATEELNLTEAIDELVAEGRLERFYLGEEEVPRPDDGLFFSKEYDGNSLIIAGLQNLTIVGVTGSDAKARLVVTPRYADVLHFARCKDIELENLTLGHTDTGDCVGDVVVLNDCRDVEIDDCKLFGCGVNGLQANRTQQLEVSDTDIYGCSDWAVTLSECSKVEFDRCNLFDNGMGIAADEGSKAVVMEECNLTNNRYTLFSCYRNVVLKRCNIQHSHGDQTGCVKLVKCRLDISGSDGEDAY